MSVWSYATDHEILGTEYVGVDDNTVSFYRYEPTQDTIYKFREIVFPLYVGKTWSFMVNRGAEYYSIPASPLVTVPAGDFSTYQVHANYRSGMLDAVSVSDLWFSPNVGFVKLDKVTGWRQTINSHEIWELVDYHVVPPLAHLIR